MTESKSRRVYITLNPIKEKDRIIENYLSHSYSESDAIKEAIYRLATNNIQTVHKNMNSTEKAQIVNDDTLTLNNETVRNGANNTNAVENIPSELEINEMDELSKFI